MQEGILNQEPAPGSILTTQEKVLSLFEFVKEMNRLKQRTIVRIIDYPWHTLISDLPDDPEHITVTYRDRVEEEQSNVATDTPILTVHKPEFQRCPQPAACLDSWLKAGWNDWRVEVQRVEYKGEVKQNNKFPASVAIKVGATETEATEQASNDKFPVSVAIKVKAAETEDPKQPPVELFQDDEERVQAYESWLKKRNDWAAKQRIYAKTRKLFTDLHGFYTDLQRDSETMEMIVANGFFRDRQNPLINHPVLTRRVRLRFDAGKNTIHVEDVDVQSELYEDVFQAENALGLNLEILGKCRAELRENDYHPLDRNDAVDFLKGLLHQISSNSFFSPDGPPGDWKPEDRFLLFLDPCFIFRRKPDGTVQTIEQIIENIQKSRDIPAPIRTIANGQTISSSEVTHEESVEEQLAAVGGESIEIFLSKEANKEQLEIAKQIERHPAVLVQGPPGTGKTHTIANLMGHFLAQGKSVLVTSHTTKALRVLKEKVAPGLQTLCVSLMDDSNADMEKSIDGITKGLSKDTPEKLKKEMDALALERENIIQNLAATRKKLYSIIQCERGSIIYQGEELSPSDAAKFVREHAQDLSYIPGQIRPNSPLPLSFENLRDLYRSNESISPNDERELECDLPDPKQIMAPAEFQETMDMLQSAYSALQAIENDTGWTIDGFFEVTQISFACNFGKFHIPYPSEESVQALRAYAQGFGTFEKWMAQAAVDGKRGGAYRQRWLTLIKQIQATCSISETVLGGMFGKNIQFIKNSNFDQMYGDFQKLKEIFSKNGKVPKFTRWINKSLDASLESVVIDGKSVRSVKDCDLVLHWIEREKSLDLCSKYWNELMAVNKMPAFRDLDPQEPERIAANHIPQIHRFLGWYESDYRPLTLAVEQLQIPLDMLFSTNALDSDFAAMEKILRVVSTDIPHICDACDAVLKIRQSNAKLDALQEILKSGKRGNSTVCGDVLAAVSNGHVETYAKARSALDAMFTRYTLREKREKWLNTLSPVAPLWAEAIRNRSGIHGSPVLPDTVEEAWKWKQLCIMLDQMAKESFDEIQSKCLLLSQQYRKATADYAEKSAWYYLLRKKERNSGLQEALEGWRQTYNRIGKGFGKRAAIWKAKAKSLMKQCQPAVPAWIMPISRALESLNPKENRFDVVIIDEASQSDLSSLAILYMGKKLIIVGDDMQVSPMAIGVETNDIIALQQRYLQGIPNAHLYDANASIYDLGKRTFRSLMLLEHFRCVPEIIGFSNMLSYNNEIKPLRAASDSNLLPAVVPYRVSDGERVGKQNPNEASAIVALVKACIEQPEYSGKTFGIISLLGDEQVKEIQSKISAHISPKIIDERKILTGNASNFQGDERDVIFLSVVESGKESGPVRLMEYGGGEAYRKRYNVAASRARDQLWVVYSLNPATDLQSRDIRKTLIDYAINPAAIEIRHAKIEEAAESPFEAAVAKSLSDHGYHLVQQWEVGAYRIDMVAICGKKMIAIECDGERYHSGEAKIRQDMERQTILERLGWRFIRIRGSEYFRDPEGTIRRVIQKLSEHGIEPEESDVQDADTHKRRDTELLRRVKSRAEMILRNHFETEIDEDTVIAAALNPKEITTPRYIVPLQEAIEEMRETDYWDQQIIGDMDNG